MRKSKLVSFVSLVVVSMALPYAHAGTPVVGGLIYVNSAQDVIATYLGNSATYEDDLYLASPTNSLGRIFGNHIDAVGTTKDLGSFPIGTQLTFDIHVTNTGNIFYSGDASQNADDHAHARVTYDYTATSSLVEFEDLLGGPYDYNDLSFSFSNVGSVHSMVTLTPTAPETVYGSQITNGTGANKGLFKNGLNTLTVSGSNSSYLADEVTGINGNTGTATDYVAATGFSPATDPEVFALDVLISGQQATPAQINTLVSDINSSNPFGYGSSIASANDPTHGVFAQLTPAGNYDLYLTFTGLTSGSNYLGFDLTQDPTYGSTATVAAIAVVPEPTSVGLGLIAAVGMLCRRSRRVRGH